MVDYLLTERQGNFLLREMLRQSPDCRAVHRPSSGASLVYTNAIRKIHATPNRPSPNTIVNDVHRFEELIAGRAYLIEVAAVAKDRWRAYIVRVPGTPTALMPFYGRTPHEAAQQLSDWLTRAHARAAAPSA
jgi:hypothetical protein